jgi:hypothetical protein
MTAQRTGFGNVSSRRHERGAHDGGKRDGANEPHPQTPLHGHKPFTVAVPSAWRVNAVAGRRPIADAATRALTVNRNVTYHTAAYCPPGGQR